MGSYFASRRDVCSRVRGLADREYRQGCELFQSLLAHAPIGLLTAAGLPLRQGYGLFENLESPEYLSTVTAQLRCLDTPPEP